MKKKVFLFMLLSRLSLCANTRTLAALDIGSGGIKVIVARVNRENATIQETCFAHEYAVPFKRDMETRGENSFSKEVQQLALQTLRRIKKDADSYGPVKFFGIATAASRKASNAEAFYAKVAEDLGIPIRIVSQKEEGLLGFYTAEAVSKAALHDLVCYDSGVGSFQLIAQIESQIEVVEAESAYMSALSILMRDIRQEKLDMNSSPNPISLEEARQISQLLQKQHPAISASFAAKLLHPQTKIIGIGNQNFIFATAARALGKNSFTKQEVWEAIAASCHKADSELRHFYDPQTAVIGMILLYSVMDTYSMPTITYCPTNGCCEGLLIGNGY